MKNALKHIISMVLIAAIAITGINFGGEAVTANAAAKYETLNVNSSGDSITINMKVGETKRLLITDENKKDLVTGRGWIRPYSEDIVTITTDFTDDDWITEYMEITANDVGEVTIIGRENFYVSSDYHDLIIKESRPTDIRITIKVTKAASKLTATQKKCRHSWKTLKKATCQHVGTKTCKKCKLQKTIKKTDHKWVATTRTSYATEDIIFEIAPCNEAFFKGDFYAQIHLSDYIPHELIRRAHYVEYVATEKLENQIDIVGLPEGTEEAKEAFFKACRDACDKNYYDPRYKSTSTVFGTREVTDWDDPIVDELETCFYCNRER